MVERLDQARRNQAFEHAFAKIPELHGWRDHAPELVGGEWRTPGQGAKYLQAGDLAIRAECQRGAIKAICACHCNPFVWLRSSLVMAAPECDGYGCGGYAPI